MTNPLTHAGTYEIDDFIDDEAVLSVNRGTTWRARRWNLRNNVYSLAEAESQVPETIVRVVLNGLLRESHQSNNKFSVTWTDPDDNKLGPLVVDILRNQHQLNVSIEYEEPHDDLTGAVSSLNIETGEQLSTIPGRYILKSSFSEDHENFQRKPIVPKPPLPDGLATIANSTRASERSKLELLNCYRKEGKWTDVTLRYKDSEFPAHRMILSAACEYFEAMFRTGCKEANSSELVMDEIPGASSETIEQLLNYLYCDSSGVSRRLSCSDAIHLALFARQFSAAPLVHQALRQIPRQIQSLQAQVELIESILKESLLTELPELEVFLCEQIYEQVNRGQRPSYSPILKLLALVHTTDHDNLKAAVAALVEKVVADTETNRKTFIAFYNIARSETDSALFKQLYWWANYSGRKDYQIEFE